jgi:hypothetical protein
MFNSTYDGVVELPTAKGKVRALQFSMTSNVSTPFELRVREPNGKTTQITSSKMVSEGHVKFFTTKFSGRLLGFPVTFTPDQPPPLTLPILIFTSVTIDLVFTSSDTLTADNLTIAQI